MKKLILSIIFTFITILFISFFKPPPVFAFLGIGESSSEFDCQKFWESFSDLDGLTIGGPRTADRGISDWRFSSKKQALHKVGGDFCDIKGIRHDSDSEGEDLNGFEIEILYFPNQEETKSKISSLKAAEFVKVEDKNISGDTYSMRTVKLEDAHLRPHFLAPDNFGRTVGKVGNCVVSLTHTWYGMAEQWNTGDEYDKQVGLMDLIMEGSKIGWQKLSEAKQLQQFCGGKAELDQKPNTSQPQQTQSDQAGQPAKSAEQKSKTGKKVGEEGSRLNLLSINPLETWRNIQVLLQIPQGLNDLVESGEFIYGLKDIPITVPEPSIATDDQGNPWDFLPGYIPHESIKPDLNVRVTERTRLSDNDNHNFYEIRPGQSGQAMLKIPGKDGKNLPFLEDGEVEVIKVKSGVSDSSYDGIKTPNGTVISVQTHYLVSYDKKNNRTTVAVYEGKVEVKTKNGQITTVSPNGDRPGIVVIAQKLSVIKLGLLGLLLLVVMGGVVWLLKRRKKA